MDDQIDPADAASALSEIGRRREQVIRRAAIPGWFWWASAVLTIALAADIEFLRGALFWAASRCSARPGTGLARRRRSLRQESAI